MQLDRYRTTCIFHHGLLRVATHLAPPHFTAVCVSTLQRKIVARIRGAATFDFDAISGVQDLEGDVKRYADMGQEVRLCRQS